MPTFTAFTTLADKAKADTLAEALENLVPEPTGVGVMRLEGGAGLWEVAAYFIEAPDQAGLALAAMAFDAKPFVISELPETDWVAKVRRDLPPVVAGRFFLYGSHDADNVPEGVVALAIEAAMAFGTGHHGTTQGCLVALDRLDALGFRGKNVADIGCGTAVLAMGAAKIWPDHPVIASDIDEVAIDTAVANADFNGLAGRLNCCVCPGFEHPELQGAAPFDLVFANILKTPLILLAPDMARFIAPGGYAILSGILNEQADEVLAVYATHGFALDDRLIIEDWTTLTVKLAS